MFFWVLAGSLGLPGGTIVIIGTSSLTQGIPSLILVIAISCVAAFIGDNLAYELARRLSDRFRNKLIRFSFFRNNEPRARKLLSKHEFSIVFFTRFILLSLCPVVSYVSGFEKINRKKFYLAVFAGELLFATIYSTIGYAIGETFNNLISAIDYVAIAVVLLALIIYAVWSLVKRKRGRQRRQLVFD